MIDFSLIGMAFTAGFCFIFGALVAILVILGVVEILKAIGWIK